MKAKGLGDKIESFTKATGIKKLVDTVSQGLNIPCGCEQRKNSLNEMFPKNHNIMAKKSKKEKEIAQPEVSAIDNKINKLKLLIAKLEARK